MNDCLAVGVVRGQYFVRVDWVLMFVATNMGYFATEVLVQVSKGMLRLYPGFHRSEHGL